MCSIFQLTKILAFTLLLFCSAALMAFPGRTLRDASFVGQFTKPTSGKSFTLVNSAHQFYPSGSGSISYTPTVGNSLIAYAMQPVGATISISDGVNTWVQQVQISTGHGMCLATALNVSGSPVTITASGVANATFAVFEYSGITTFESPQQNINAGSPATLVFTATGNDGFFVAWGNEITDTITSMVLTPGSVAGNQGPNDTGQYATSWDWLNSGAGFAANTYTATFTGSAAGNYLSGIAFK